MKLWPFYKKELPRQLEVNGTRDARGALLFGQQLFNNLPSINSHIDRYRYSYPVRSAVDILAINATRIKPIVYARDNTPLPDSVIQLLLERVNPYESANLFYLKLYTEFFLYNECFVEIVRNIPGASIPSSLYLIPAASIRIDQRDNNRYYEVTGREGLQYIVPEKNMIHIHGYSGSGIHAISPLEAIASLIDNEIQVRTIQGTMISGNIYKKLITAQIDSDEELESWQSYLESLQGVMNSGGIALIPEELDKDCIFDLTTPVPVELLDSVSRQTLSAVAAVFQIPFDYLTSNFVQGKYQNGEENRKRLFDEAIIPKIDIVMNSLSTRLNKEFKEDIIIRGDYSTIDALQSSQKDLADQLKTLVEAGMNPRSAFRITYGYEAAPEDFDGK